MSYFFLDIRIMNNNDRQSSAPVATVVAVVYNEHAYEGSEKVTRDLSSDIEQDEALARKMQYVNDAIDEIGFTSYQLKLFFLNGFGYAVDSLLILLNALTQRQVALQYQPFVSKAQTISVGIGLLFGALFWGLGADITWSMDPFLICHSLPLTSIANAIKTVIKYS
jgi:hypothetical protein